MTETPNLILHGGPFTTLDRSNPTANAVAIKDGVFTAVGRREDIVPCADPSTRIIDLKGRRVLPGLIDNHIHFIRGGLTFNAELRWDGVPTLSAAMELLKRQVAVTPPPQWVRVIGGYSEQQFAEKRLPAIEELNAVAPDTPGGELVRDGKGNPTGLLLAKPNATILYATIAKAPKLPFEYQINSTRHFMRDLNRLGVTGVIDAGGGFHYYPEDYQVIRKLAADGLLTIRIAYNLFTTKPKKEKDEFLSWIKTSKYQEGDDYFRHNGAGEMLVFSAADFEDFRQPRPDMPPDMESDLEEVVRLLATNRWPWRLHATYDETISRALDVFEKVDKDIPLKGLNWIFDHAETISDKSIGRVAALGGGIAVQHRMAYQGEYFVARYGARAAEATPPVAKIIAAGAKISAGTDATRVSSHNPWVALAWLATGKTVGGLRLYPQANCLDRETALRMWTENVTWFSNEEGKKGRIQVGQFADLIIPDRDYFSCAGDEIADTTSLLTMVGGKIVYAAGEFSPFDEGEVPPAMPDWSPVRRFGDHGAWSDANSTAAKAATHQRLALACNCANVCAIHGHNHAPAWSGQLPVADLKSFWGALGCACWAV
jgi:predicted amidohydrolase YtcJ